MNFFSHIEYLSTGGYERLKLDVILCVVNFFESVPADCFYIMDPYLEVERSIHEPFKDNLIESRMWSFLLSELANTKVEFRIITGESVDAICGLDDPPFSIPISQKLNGATVSVCKYLNTKFSDLSIHDRYIVGVRKGVAAAGLHLGPSLDDILNKDVSITAYTDESASAAMKSFEQIWTECVKTKSWKKG